MTRRFSLRTLGRGLAAAALAALLLPGAEASAQGKVVAGTLTCEGEGSVGLIVGSQQRLACTYVPAGGGSPQRYAGTITKIGLDIGFTTQSTIVWTVLGSAGALNPEVLRGNYAGASAQATVALGIGANALIGGSNDSIVLQPLSVQGQTGLNIAVGISGLSLR